jgi:hypothetical protein
MTDLTQRIAEIKAREKEEWTPILEYEWYLVSNFGEIINSRTGKHLKQHLDHKGYYKVVLWDAKRGRKNFRVHRIVLSAFDRSPFPDEVCRHKNDVRTDNTISNLCWGNSQDNVDDMVSRGRSEIGERNAHAKLTENQVMWIIENKGKIKGKKMAAALGITAANVSSILKNKAWKHLPRKYPTHD